MWKANECDSNAKEYYNNFATENVIVGMGNYIFKKGYNTSTCDVAVAGICNKDKDKDVFIGPKEFVSHMMMTQTKYRLHHQLK